jgi:hypothetical protein
MLGFIKEFCLFLGTRKRFWLVPVIVIVCGLGGLIVFAEGSVLAPLIYTLF